MNAPSGPRARALPEVDPARCTGCAQCAVVCPFNAITMVRRSEVPS